MPFLFRNEECYVTRKNLKPLQTRYNDIYLEARPIQAGRKDAPFMGMGLTGAVVPDGHGRLHREKLTEHSPIYDPTELRLISLTRLHAWATYDGAARQFRLNAIDQRFAVSDDGVVCVGPPSDFRDSRQVDYSLNPRQDPPLVDQQTVEETTSLLSPFPGPYKVYRSDRFVDIFVARRLVYRILVEDMAYSTLTPEREVDEGDVLLTIEPRDREVYYAVTRRGDQDAVLTSRLPPDVLPVSRWPEMAHVCNESWSQIVQASLHPQSVTLCDPVKWAPIPMLQFSDVSSIRRLPGFEVNDYLRNMILDGLGPQGDFRLRADLPENLDTDIFKSVEPVIGQDHLVKIVYGSGHEQVVPASAIPVVRPGTSVGHLDPIADFCSRFSHDGDLDNQWRALVAELGANYNSPVDEFLYQSCVLPGELGWMGNGILIDQRLVDSAASQAVGHKIDCRPCLPYLDKARGVYIFPPIRHADWQEWSLTLNQIRYDLTPVGEVLRPEARREQRHSLAIS